MTKGPFLVCYDYGQGGFWAFVNSPSEEGIKVDYPDLEVVEEQPAWMTGDEAALLPVLDVEAPTGLLADLHRTP